MQILIYHENITKKFKIRDKNNHFFIAILKTSSFHWLFILVSFFSAASS